VKLRPLGCVLEIERDAALVRVAEEIGERAIGGDDATGERRREPTRISARRLDLGDVGAEVGEHPAGEGPAQIGEIEDVEMLEQSGRRRRHAPRSRPGNRDAPPITWVVAFRSYSSPE